MRYYTSSTSPVSRDTGSPGGNLDIDECNIKMTRSEELTITEINVNTFLLFQITNNKYSEF